MKELDSEKYIEILIKMHPPNYVRLEVGGDETNHMAFEIVGDSYKGYATTLRNYVQVRIFGIGFSYNVLNSCNGEKPWFHEKGMM